MLSALTTTITALVHFQYLFGTVTNTSELCPMVGTLKNLQNYHIHCNYQWKTENVIRGRVRFRVNNFIYLHNLQHSKQANWVHFLIYQKNMTNNEHI